jgi:Flp pilus assembly protein TadD
MSIIQDALKKAQEERTKKKNRAVPYHRSDAQKKPKTVIYTAAVLFCVVAIIAYLYVPYFHKAKQTPQPLAPQATGPVAVNVLSAPEAQKPVKETPEKKSEGPIVVAPQKPVEKSATPQAPNKKQDFAGAGTGIVHVQQSAISLPVKRKTKTVEPTDKDTMKEPARAVEKKTDDGSADSTYNEALREQQSGRTREAKILYKQILAKQPGQIEALNNLGVIAIYEGNTQEALLYFKRILEYRKDYSKAYNNIGLLTMKDGDRQLAEEYLRKAISLEPNDPEPYLNLSALLRSQGRLQEAAKLLEIPIGNKSKDPALFLSYAVVKDNLGQYDDAARYYRQYLSSMQTPTSRKDIIERLQYIEKKIMPNDQITITK